MRPPECRYNASVARLHTHQRRVLVTGRVVAFTLIGILSTSALPAQEPQLPSILVARQLAALEGIAIGDEVELASGEPGGSARPGLTPAPGAGGRPFPNS